MNTRMSMRDRRKKIAALVQNDPRVQACSIEFEAAQMDITDWHAHKDALCATTSELTELDELIAYSAFCLEDLKCAKRCAYERVTNQYPRVWDTTCADPFDTDIHDDTGTTCTEATGEADTSADADEASCTCAMCQALDALDNLERDNITVKVILMPVHEGPSEYEEEGEQ